MKVLKHIPTDQEVEGVLMVERRPKELYLDQRPVIEPDPGWQHREHGSAIDVRDLLPTALLETQHGNLREPDDAVVRSCIDHRGESAFDEAAERIDERLHVHVQQQPRTEELLLRGAAADGHRQASLWLTSDNPADGQPMVKLDAITGTFSPTTSRT